MGLGLCAGDTLTITPLVGKTMGPFMRAEGRSCRLVASVVRSEPLLLCPSPLARGERQDEESLATCRCIPGAYHAAVCAVPTLLADII